MGNKVFLRNLELVARAYNTTPENICNTIVCAMSEGRLSRDPQILALFDALPGTGPVLTLEDFVEYLAQTLSHPFGT